MAGLSEKTRKFVMEITTGGSSPEAAAASVGIPQNAIPALMSSPAIRREIDLALGRQGINEDYFSTKLKQLCEAETPKGDPDWSARSKGLTMLKDIYGHDAPKEIKQTTTTITYEERLLQIADSEVEGISRITKTNLFTELPYADN